jgi:hypothetical protein
MASDDSEYITLQDCAICSVVGDMFRPALSHRQGKHLCIARGVTVDGTVYSTEHVPTVPCPAGYCYVSQRREPVLTPPPPTLLLLRISLAAQFRCGRG